MFLMMELLANQARQMTQLVNICTKYKHYKFYKMNFQHTMTHLARCVGILKLMWLGPTCKLSQFMKQVQSFQWSQVLHRQRTKT